MKNYDKLCVYYSIWKFFFFIDSGFVYYIYTYDTTDRIYMQWDTTTLSAAGALCVAPSSESGPFNLKPLYNTR